MLAQDFIEPFDAPEPEGCQCEQALQATCDRLKRDLETVRAEIESLQHVDKQAWQLAQDVIQSVTLEDAKKAASIYLGLAQPF